MKTTKLALAVITLLGNPEEVMAAQLKTQNNLKSQSYNKDDELGELSQESDSGIDIDDSPPSPSH